MVIGNRLKELRESKQLSQGDIEKRTGLLRCYISRVENGHTVPAIETLEKMARALEVPMYRLFHDGGVPAGLSKLKPPNCAGYLRKWNLTTKNCSCTWPKKSGETRTVPLTDSRVCGNLILFSFPSAAKDVWRVCGVHLYLATI